MYFRKNIKLIRVLKTAAATILPVVFLLHLHPACLQAFLGDRVHILNSLCHADTLYTFSFLLWHRFGLVGHVHLLGLHPGLGAVACLATPISSFPLNGLQVILAFLLTIVFSSTNKSATSVAV